MLEDGVPQSEMAFPGILKWHQGFLHLLNLLAFADWIDLRRITNITVISHNIIPAIYLQYKSITVHLHPNIFLYKNDKVSAWPPRRCAGSFRQHLEPSDPGWPRWKKRDLKDWLIVIRNYLHISIYKIYNLIKVILWWLLWYNMILI